MRFMMLMIPLGYETAPPDVQLDPERVAAMMRYNEALKDAGVLITLDGLHPPSMGARVSFATGVPIVTDGPFAEAKEVLGGYWMIEVASREEAIAWAKKCPASATESHRDPPGAGDGRLSAGGAGGRRRLRRPEEVAETAADQVAASYPSSINKGENHEHRYLSRRLPRQQDQPEMGRMGRDVRGRAEGEGAGGHRGLERLGREASRRDRRAMGGPLGKTKKVDGKRGRRHQPTRWAPSPWSAPPPMKPQPRCSRTTRTSRSSPASAVEIMPVLPIPGG